MKIYTKKGDAGETSLLGGEKVLKNDLRLQAYGTIDELNSYLGFVIGFDIKKEYKQILLNVQKKLFIIGSYLAKSDDFSVVLSKITIQDIVKLEGQIDNMEDKLPTLKNFIIPGGSKKVAVCHIARSVCRRAERTIVALNQKKKVDNLILQYLNRLSDYLFVLARTVAKDDNTEEIKIDN